MGEVINAAMAAATLKSKTINGNMVGAALAPVLIIAARKIGLELSAEEAAAVVGGGFFILNALLRFFTNSALADKLNPVR